MATDATGTPTPLGIPKFNTANDAPSGLGFNAVMDSIDTLIAARVLGPAGIVSGEVPVWNGTAWVRSSVTKIGPTSLTGFTAWTPVWGSAGTAPTLGNGTLNGRYIRLGNLIIAQAQLAAGTTTTFGTGTYTFTIPVAGVDNTLMLGIVRILDTSIANFSGVVIDGGAGLVNVLVTGGSTFWTNSNPFTFGNTDSCTAVWVYEAA